jgi:hypothetical protein
MRPLFHLSIEEVTVEGILHALSDPVRVAMYADIVARLLVSAGSTPVTAMQGWAEFTVKSIPDHEVIVLA